ncbi:MAG: AAA family ATPase [Actinoallomurus sp.]
MANSAGDSRARRYPKTSIQDAWTKAEHHETWVIDGIISSDSTLLVGEAKVGKSFLASALVAALTTGGDFLGRPVPQDREFSVAICWTDDGGDVEYGERIRTVLPDEMVPKVDLYGLSTMESRDDWRKLFEEVMEDGHNFVIIDNLSQCVDGSVNNDADVRRFYEGVRQFTRAGIPVVIIAHSTDKAGPNGYKPEKPMGSSYITQAVRWRCFVRRSRKDNLILKFIGNHASPHEITVKHGAGARFEVLAAAESTEITQKRDKERLDRNALMAQWVVENCQGIGVNQAGRMLAEKFGGAESTQQKALKAGGSLAALLSRFGEGPQTVWSLS